MRASVAVMGEENFSDSVSFTTFLNTSQTFLSTGISFSSSNFWFKFVRIYRDKTSCSTSQVGACGYSE